MLYRRRDFRPDKQPHLMSNKRWRGFGLILVELKPRAASKHRQAYKNEHNNRQRTYDRKLIRKELDEFEQEKDDERET